MGERARWDASDPVDAMAESFRRQITNIVLNAGKAAVYRDMPTGDQVTAIMGGVMTGLIGVLFAHVQPQGRDALIEALTEYIPQARENAEAMLP